MSFCIEAHSLILAVLVHKAAKLKLESSTIHFDHIYTLIFPL